ncbi:hypothetical protein L1987_49651 [Smallanthus sonchifolius]|uniref:Uncharacterized protein n=1 Tax=Smallanthus sonchifolius TaxID=185202 RepID=A0ACB9FWC3_9ASTR|nr:hypothetical protein L1987_49651 [Smallanthus sonchifolius]
MAGGHKTEEIELERAGDKEDEEWSTRDIFLYDADYDVIQWYDLSVVGKTVDLAQLCGLHESLSNGGIKVRNMRYLGGLHVLLTFKEYSEANDLVKDKHKWSKVFSNLEIWTSQDYAYERIVWLKIHGVPAHLWESQVFDKIVGSVGEPGVILHPSIPDLNNSMGGSSSVGIGDSRGYDSIPQTNPNDAGAAVLREEIEATCEMGNLLGVNLNGKEDLVRSVILGEVSLTGYP